VGRRQQLYTDNPFVTVERKVGGSWVTFADQVGEVPGVLHYPASSEGGYDPSAIASGTVGYRAGGQVWKWTATSRRSCRASRSSTPRATPTRRRLRAPTVSSPTPLAQGQRRDPVHPRLRSVRREAVERDHGRRRTASTAPARSPSPPAPRARSTSRRSGARRAPRSSRTTRPSPSESARWTSRTPSRTRRRRARAS